VVFSERVLAFSSFFFKLHIPNFIHLPIRTLITCDLYSGVTAYDQPKRLNLPVSSITRQGLSRVNIRTLGTVTFEQHSTSKKSESDQTKSLTPRMCCSPFHKMFKTTECSSHQEVIVASYLSVTSLNTQLSDPLSRIHCRVLLPIDHRWNLPTTISRPDIDYNITLSWAYGCPRR
jgi:hypothetical protein